MRIKTLLFSVMTVLFLQSFGQTIGAKKTVVLKLVMLECEDECYLEMVDTKTNTKYMIESRDVKTRNWDMIEENNYNARKLNGKSFKVELEYRHPQYFGEKKPNTKEKRWMINSITPL